MKKRIGYVLLILISILGSRLIFGKDYHLNSDNLLENNMYLYDIYNQKEVKILLVDDEYLYYIVNQSNAKSIQYDLVKHNLITNKVVNDYVFNPGYLFSDANMFTMNGYLYLTAINSNTYYKFNKHLNLVDKIVSSGNYNSYGIYKDGFVTTLGNQLFYNDNVYDTVYNSCGPNVDILYDNSTYLHFHNGNTGFGCLYNVSSKKIEYLDYEKILVVKNKLLEYQNNRQSFKYNGDVYYFNDITESNNLKMHSNGDYLFTIDMTHNTLNIYNLETKKIIFEKDFIELRNGVINNILIDDYAYFTITSDNKTKLYIWDYLKENRKNKNMISYDEKEYKFKNNELKEELKNKYNIDIYIYDQAVTYFDNYYVIPSYDDILINSRLNILKTVFERLNQSEITKLSGIRISLVNDIISNTSGNDLDIIINNSDGINNIVVNVTKDDFNDNVVREINNILLNN